MAELHDIHNPPKEPYKHQEFPKLVYAAPKGDKHPHESYKQVNDESELKAALKAGFSEKPVYPEAEEAKDDESFSDPKPRKSKKAKEEVAE